MGGSALKNTQTRRYDLDEYLRIASAPPITSFLLLEKRILDIDTLHSAKTRAFTCDTEVPQAKVQW